MRLVPHFSIALFARETTKVESKDFFGIVNSFVLDDLPGVVRKPGKSGEGYDARQTARMTLTEFRRYFISWLVEIYHNTPISESDMTPNELWRRSEEEFLVPEEDEMGLMPILMATATRELTRGSINLFSLNYDSPILRDIYRRDGSHTVTIKYNPFDIGFILVLDRRNNIYLKIECSNFPYASGLSLFEHRRIKCEARKSGKLKLENLDLLRAKVKLSKERDALHARNGRRKTQVTLSKAARSEKIGVDGIKLVVDNSRNIVRISEMDKDEELSMDGWGVEI